MALIAAHLNAGVILAVTLSQCSDRYIITLFPTHLPSPVPNKPYRVSVDVKHHERRSFSKTDAGVFFRAALTYTTD